MSDVYAEFGVNNAVISSSDIAEHEETMLGLDVATRDGDDEISLDALDSEEESEELEGEEGAEESEESDEEEAPEESDGEFDPLPEAGEELKAASTAVIQASDGFTALRDQAMRAGLPEEVAQRIEAEYEADNQLSEGSYKALEEAGYSRQFVESYIQGQEAVAERFVAEVVAYAGGRERFQSIMAHMGASSPENVESLQEAIERQDLKAIRTIINLGMQSHAKKFGKAPTRNVIKSAPAAKASRAPKTEGYSSRQEMVADMSKSEYRLDPAFRAKVEARVAASTF